jgi:hypothetical protein
VCTSGYILTTDNLACLVAVGNCAVYAGSTIQSSALQCSQCADGYYLGGSGSTVTCTSGTVTNCKTYAVNANTCLVCANLYYLSNSACVAHLTLANCLIYDATNANACSICSAGFYSFLYTSVCVQTSTISNCVAYAADGNTCTLCSANFYLAGGICVSIPVSFANCVTYSGAACQLCNSGYMVNTIGNQLNCVAPLDYLLASTNSPCSQVSVFASTLVPTWTNSISSIQAPYSCLTCANFMYGYSPQGSEALCILTIQLSMYSGFTSVTNCKRYGMNYAVTQAVVCMECISGYFLTGYQTLAQTSTATSCLSTCPSLSTNSNAVIPDDFLGFVNICVSPTANIAFQASGTCYRYGRRSSQTLNVFTGLSTAVVSNDFFCFAAALSTTTPPTNYLKYTPTLTADSYFPFDITSATVPATTSIDFVMGFTSNLDLTSISPSVFNYKGILKSIVSDNTVLGAGFFLNNNLANCDIVWMLGTISALGTPFAGNSAPYLYNQPIRSTTYATCLRCAFGYRPTFTLSNTVATNPPFPSCLQMNNCASLTTVYGGLPTFLNSVFSCHSCAQSVGQTTYPTFYMDIDVVGTTDTTNAPGTYLSYTLTGVYGNNGASIATQNHGFACSAAPGTLVSDVDGATVGTINGCAAYAALNLLTAYATADTAQVAGDGSGATSSAVVNVCVACAANYFPVYAAGANAPSTTASFVGIANVPVWIVFSCTAGLNCDSSALTMFNGCTRCRSDQESSLVPIYYGFHDYLLTNCYPAATQNCLILDSTTFSSVATTNNCAVCKSGYLLNSDLVCEKYILPNMLATAFFVHSYYASKLYPLGQFAVQTIAQDAIYVRITYLVAFGRLQYGSTACNAGYTLAPINSWAGRLCVWSSYVYNNGGTYPITSLFIPNCLRYNLTMVNARQICGGCISGFIPTIDGLSCVNSASLSNCVFAQSGANTALCYQCATNYYNVGGQCSTGTISNCASYINTRWSFVSPGALQCAGCNDGFVLATDYLSCYAGNVTNCVTYAQGLTAQCLACKSGFVLISLTSLYYCYPVPASLNCAQLSSSAGNSGANVGTISCATCSTASTVYGSRTWTSSTLSTAAASLCMPFSGVTNCAIYDQNNPVIASNTFACTKCNSGYWLNAARGSCNTRTVTPTSCATFSETADLCTSCTTGFFLGQNGQSCVAFPTGIQNCVAYTGPSVCSQCAAGTYLNNNVCVVSTVISNCQVYSGNYSCTACRSGYFLTNSTSCIPGVANNCLNYTTASICGGCPSGFGLQTYNGVTNCVQILIPNCINATTVFPFSCNVCAQGFYPSSTGICMAVTSMISGCLIYDTATTCLMCAQGTVLNLARSACEATMFTGYVDPNCNQSFILSTAQCAVCEMGYYFINGNCAACTNNTLAQGCMSCDPVNSQTCLLCSPKYYMNSTGACVNSVTIATNITNTTNDTKGSTFAGAERLWAVVLTTLVLMIG